MRNSSNENNINFTIRDIEFRIKKYQLWTAIAVLIGALIPTVTTFTKIDEVLKNISRLADKPLEGEWDYVSKYDKYYNETDLHMLQGMGKAIIIWKNLDKRYEVNISYGITRAKEVSKPLLASFLHGYLEADEDGWPQSKNFTIDTLRILNRVHYQGQEPIQAVYEFKDCKYFKNNEKDERIRSIECVFETPISKSYVRLKFNKTLH